MTIRNRELSQFGSFIYIQNDTKDIGITTEATPYVGIGTTNATAKLHVVGTTNLEGNVEVFGDTTFNGNAAVANNFTVSGLSTFSGITTFTNDVYGDSIFSNSINASSFYLNGSLLVDASLETWEPAPLDSATSIYREQGNVGIGTSTNLYKLSVNGQIESQAPQGTPPLVVSSTTNIPNLNASLLSGKSAPTGDIVGTSDSQTLTTKTINLSNNTLTGTTAEFNTALSDGSFATTDGIETLTNKTLTSPIISSISNSGTQTIPTGTGTLVSTNSVGIITSGMIGDLEITNADVSNSAAIEFSKISTVGVGNSIENADIADGTIQNAKLVNSTISGISLGSNLSNLTAGTYLSGTSYNGSSPQTWNVSATSANTADQIVARDSSGNFSAGTITANFFSGNGSNLTGIVTSIQAGENITILESPSGNYIVTATGGGGGSGTYDTGITTSVYISVTSGIGTAQAGLTTSQANNNIFIGPGIGYSFPSTAGKSYVIESMHITNIFSNELYLSSRHDFSGGENVPTSQRLIVPYQGAVELIEEPIVAKPSDIIRMQAFSGVGTDANGVDGGLDAFIVYSEKDDNDYIGTGATVVTPAGTELFTSTTNPSVLQSIRLCNYDLAIDVDASVSIYRGGTVGGIVTTGVRQGYLVYNLTVPKNSVIEILEKPKYLAANDSIVVGIAGTNLTNSLSATLSGKYIV